MTRRKGFGERYQDLLDRLLAGVPPGELRLLSPEELGRCLRPSGPGPRLEVAPSESSK